MDWLLRPLLFLGLILVVYATKNKTAACAHESCSSIYQNSMEEAGISEPEPSPEYCEIMRAYDACLAQTKRGCRGNLNYHGTTHGLKKLKEENCTKKPRTHNERDGPKTQNDPPGTPRQPLYPSCKYFGTYKFRHCGLYGDPHLKTFNGVYQTCRVHGTWTLINNPYMNVQVTNEMLVVGSSATAPTKISVIVKGRSTPCTLEKRYEASSELPLPTTFTDNTDKSGADETVTLKTTSYPKEDRETAEIVMKYVASKLIIRRKGKYLAFNAKVPEEVSQLSKSDDDKNELCGSGCPDSELLDIVSARGHLVEREEALRLCRSTEYLSDDIANNLTDSYLDWCVFDVMTAGKNRDFIDAAHSAQSDALKLDMNSLENRTTLIDIPYNSVEFNAGYRVSNLQLPFYVTCLMTLANRVFFRIRIFL